MKINNVRTKKVVVGGVSIAISQALSSVMAFVLTGILSRAFSPDQFGLWSLLMTFTASFLGFDLGFGNALRNRLAQAYSKGEPSDKSRGYFLSVFYLFLLLSSFICVLVVVFRSFIPWDAILKTQDTTLVNEGGLLFVIGIISTAFSLAFGLNAAGFFSYQESQWNAISTLFSKAVVLIVAWLLLKFKASFFLINISFLLVTVLSSMVALLIFMRKRNWNFAIIPLEVLKHNARELWRKSVQFAALQFIAFIFVSVDLFFISKLFGLDVVGNYSLVKRLYVLVSVFHFAFLMPIWSAYTDAFEAKDFIWIKKILRKTLFYTILVFVLAGVSISTIGEKFIYLWSGKVVPNHGVYILLGIWALLTGIVNCYSVLLNSMGKLKLQILASLIGIVVMLSLSLWWGKAFGLNGICLALVVSNLPMLLVTGLQTHAYLLKVENAAG